MTRANPATTHDNAGIAARRFNLKAEIHSYQDCEDFLDGEFSQELGPHMTVLLGSDSPEPYYAVRLYDTEIIRYYPDGTFSVDNGGYATPTTRERLMAVLPPGWIVFHKRKKLHLVQTKGHLHVAQVWPATHDKRVKI